jgi:hypothetical protein
LESKYGDVLKLQLISVVTVGFERVGNGVEAKAESKTDVAKLSKTSEVLKTSEV